MALNNWPQLYAGSLANSSDVAEEIGKAQAVHEIARLIGTVNGKWIGVPWTVGGGLIAYRKSWSRRPGRRPSPRPGGFPRDRQEAEGQGAADRPDRRPHVRRRARLVDPYIWSWGGKEVEADGKTVVLNSKETVESIKFAVALWKETMDEGGLAWDDTNNNRAFLSQTISATNNGASIYIEASASPTPTRQKGHADVAGHPACAHSQGAAGQFTSPGAQTHMLMGYSKNQKAAKDFLRWAHSKPVYDQWFVSQQG